MKGFNKENNLLLEEATSEISFSGESEEENLFSTLYEQFSPALYGLVLKWVKDKALAETILENVFVNAWLSRKLYDSKKERIFTWLYRISNTTATHYLKHKE